MIYLDLFLGFLKVGCFSFGGAYGAIPLIRDVVLNYGWLTDEQLTSMIAVSESTPGPIMVNLATYVGSTQAGICGAILATFAVIFPAFVIILLITALLRSMLHHPYIKAVLGGLKPCMIGIILATGLYMTVDHCLIGKKLDMLAAGITIALAAIMISYKKHFKKKLSPILLIILSGIAGILVYGI
ncbi:MAG: chromate transporter [Lachnospiraceae bacterium]|jgi:chromate transporter|nr:chromate transporter [Lachnospiraceae bacterium]